jgi:hypothetical protein
VLITWSTATICLLSDDMTTLPIVLVITCIIDRQDGTEIIIKAYEYVHTRINI